MKVFLIEFFLQWEQKLVGLSCWLVSGAVWLASLEGPEGSGSGTGGWFELRWDDTGWLGFILVEVDAC